MLFYGILDDGACPWNFGVVRLTVGRMVEVRDCCYLYLPHASCPSDALLWDPARLACA